MVAKQLGTTTASLSRWRSGISRPRKEIEARARFLAKSEFERSPLFVKEQSEDFTKVEAAISRLLEGLREEFHKSSSLSNRQDVLDLVAVLLFAHVSSIDNGGRGLGGHLKVRGASSVEAINTFVQNALRDMLSTSSFQLNKADFFKGLGKTEEIFADKLLTLFAEDAASFAKLHQAGRDDIINEIFGRFMSTSFVDEKEMGQYLTPPEIVRFMVELGITASGDELLEDGLILDPSCGVASFLSAAIRSLHAKARQVRPPVNISQWLHSLMSERVIGIDKSERMTRLATLALTLFGAGNVNIYKANALATRGAESEVTKSLEAKARLILTNPPFGATYKGSETEGFEMTGSNGRAESEVLFIEKYFAWLAPGGVLVSIVPDSVLVNRGSFSRLREWLFPRCHIEAVISLPSVAFAASGTTVKTSILVLRKPLTAIETRPSTFFAVATNIGFVVNTRGGHRRRIHTAVNDLPLLLEQYTARSPYGTELSVHAKRWDAPYHIGLPSEYAAIVDAPAESFLKVSDVAFLVEDRNNPRQEHSGTFRYIEISDVDLNTGMVGYKDIAVGDAPSRARKKVHTGDVLISTVRPERGAIGIVPPELHGAICSTGFAVLRCLDFEPLALVWLLKTETVKHQMLKHNIGIAYPAIAEQTCMELTLPMKKGDIHQISSATATLKITQQEFLKARTNLLAQIEALDVLSSSSV